jgi:hypothetical protein
VENGRKIGDDLLWLSDTPLFIDRALVAGFFDAIVRPSYELGTITLSKSDKKVNEIKGALELSAGFRLPWLVSWFTKAEASGKLTGEASHEGEHEKGSTVELKIPESSVRQLEELVSYYLANHRECLILNNRPVDEPPPNGKMWFDIDSGVPARLPRPMVFLELAPETKLIPTAAEFTNNKIVLLFDELATALTTESGGPMRYFPEPQGPNADMAKLRVDRQKYWGSFADLYSATVAMRIIEGAASENGRIRWIDFRLGGVGQLVEKHLSIIDAAS